PATRQQEMPGAGDRQELGDAFDDAEQEGGEEVVQGAGRRERGRGRRKRSGIAVAPPRCFISDKCTKAVRPLSPDGEIWRNGAVPALARRLRIRLRPSPVSRLPLPVSRTASGARPPCPPTKPSRSSSRTTRSNSSTCALPTCAA